MYRLCRSPGRIRSRKQTKTGRSGSGHARKLATACSTQNPQHVFDHRLQSNRRGFEVIALQGKPRDCLPCGFELRSCRWHWRVLPCLKARKHIWRGNRNARVNQNCVQGGKFGKGQRLTDPTGPQRSGRKAHWYIRSEGDDILCERCKFSIRHVRKRRQSRRVGKSQHAAQGGSSIRRAAADAGRCWQMLDERQRGSCITGHQCCRAQRQIIHVRRHPVRLRPFDRQRQNVARGNLELVPDRRKRDKTIQKMVPVTPAARHMQCQIDLGRGEDANPLHSRRRPALRLLRSEPDPVQHPVFAEYALLLRVRGRRTGHGATETLLPTCARQHNRRRPDGR